MTTAMDRQASPMRPRNPRGQGARLRMEIVEAAGELLAETGDPNHITIRGVAKKAGITAPSVYRHFPSLDHLILAVAQRYFDELAAAQLRSEQGLSDPLEVLLARCRTYCRFALDHPGHYQLMFRAALAPSLAIAFDDAPGRSSFEMLVQATGRCLSARGIDAGEEARHVAALIWAGEHGLVSLQISRPRFPWRSMGDLVDEMVRRLVGG